MAKKRQDPAPTSIRLSTDIKEALRKEGRQEQKEMGGPPRSVHFLIVQAVKQWLEQRLKEREAKLDELKKSMADAPPG